MTAMAVLRPARMLWRRLTAMRTALILLFLLAMGSIPGSVLPQQGSDPAAVQQYYASHPSLAPWLNHLGLFNVFAAPWFAAIYLLLFTSLVGCVVPRTFKLAGAARAVAATDSADSVVSTLPDSGRRSRLRGAGSGLRTTFFACNRMRGTRHPTSEMNRSR